METKESHVYSVDTLTVLPRVSCQMGKLLVRLKESDLANEDFLSRLEAVNNQPILRMAPHGSQGYFEPCHDLHNDRAWMEDSEQRGDGERGSCCC